MWRYLSRIVHETVQQVVKPGARTHQTAIVPAATADHQNPGSAGQDFHHQNRQRQHQHQNQNQDHQHYGACHRRYLCESWLNAVSWSGAVVLGWYASHLSCLQRKWENVREQQISKASSIFDNIKTEYPKIFNSGVEYSQEQEFYKPNYNLNRLVNYEPFGLPFNASNDTKSDFENASDEAEREFKEVFRSIENKLAVIAIDDGKLKEGLSMLQSSAQKNYAPALFNLAVCYEKGVGVKKDEKMAMEMYRAAAVKNHPGAMYNLAVFYGQGRGGLTRDLATANELLQVAAAQGQKEAISALNQFKLNDAIPAEKTKTSSSSLGYNENIKMSHLGNSTLLSY